MNHHRSLALLSGALVLPQAASAQFAVTVLPSIIGNTIAQMGAASAEGACMSGGMMPVSEIAEARAPSIATMQRYFEAARGGGAKSGAFQLDGKTRWSAPGMTADAAQIDAATDPLARAEATLVDRPLRFFRSGMDATALGQWAVQGRGGAVLGVYTALLVRRSGVWKLRTLAVSPAGERVEPAMQFCHSPGDVTKFNVDMSKLVRENAEKRLAKAQRRAAESARIADASAARAGAQPRRSGPSTQVALDRAEADRLAAELRTRETALAEAQAAERKAQEAAAMVAARTVDAAQGMMLADRDDAPAAN